jgi:hypothetical protein
MANSLWRATGSLIIGSLITRRINGKPAVLKIRVGTNHQPELVAYASDLNPVRWSPRGDWIGCCGGNRLQRTSLYMVEAIVSLAFPTDELLTKKNAVSRIY